MRETPKALTPNTVKRERYMDNPQATGENTMIPTIEIIAGLYMGEGHFSVSKYQTKNKKWPFKAEVGFSNSDPALIDAVCSWLVSVGVHHWIRQNSQGCYQLVVQHHDAINTVIEHLEPHLFGNKKAEAALVKRFCHAPHENQRSRTHEDGEQPTQSLRSRGSRHLRRET